MNFILLLEIFKKKLKKRNRQNENRGRCDRNGCHVRPHVYIRPFSCLCDMPVLHSSSKLEILIISFAQVQPAYGGAGQQLCAKPLQM